MKIYIVSIFVTGTVIVLPSDVLAAVGGLQVVTVEANAEGGQTYTLSLQILALMTALTLLPALLLSMTSFTLMFERSDRDMRRQIASHCSWK